MGIYDEILSWSIERLPAWRQDALRRLCESGDLTTTDLDEIYDLARQHQGLAPATDPPLVPQPFSASHFPAEPGAADRVSLTSLRDLKNVGRIAPGQSLDLHPTGLTVAYGGNGSGKTGYARVLKQACRARSPGTVYPNAYAEDFEQLVPSAEIKFTVNGLADGASWTFKQPCRPELRAVSVFDSASAEHYLRSQEPATYQPTAFGYLQELALGISDALGSRIDAEMRALQVDVSPFNAIPAGTVAGQAVRPLTAETYLSNLTSIGTLTDEELAELESLPGEISEADPTAKAENLDNARIKVESIAASLTQAKAAVSDDRLQQCKDAWRKQVDAEAAEKAAAELLQAEDPKKLLPGTGESVWTALFRAAQAFSVDTAYAGKPFPVVDDGSQCVLCQQELDPHARSRMGRFNVFINDAASSLATEARTAYARDRQSLQAIVQPPLPSPVVLESLEKRSQGITQQLKDLASDLSARLLAMKACAETSAWTDPPPYSTSDPLLGLASIAKSLADEAKSLRENLDPVQLAAKRSKLRELQARKLLNDHLPAIGKVVANLDRQAKLAACKTDAAATRGISRFAGQLAKSYISDSLASQMNDQLKQLDLHHIDANVEFEGDYGAVRLHIKLPKANLNPHQVLSEAEQRICSLAYFFAEQIESKSTSAIVFDDPVTSLDHDYRTAVARRIVEEAEHRQVIVFTHDAVFFGELQFFADDLGVAPEIRAIEHRAEGPGCIDAALPWDMRGHKDRIKEHRLRYAEIVKNFTNPPGDTERLAMRNAYNDLRTTLEVGIEDVVLNGTVTRFRDNISVGRLARVSTVEKDEFEAVQSLHDRCCRQVSAHSHARGQQRSVAQPSDLLADLNAVDNLLKTIRDRRAS